MGTRSITTVYDNGKKLVSIYRQMDGYPTGMGADLKEILKGRKLVNGYNSDSAKARSFNGMGCMAAQLIAELKDGIGSIYIHPVDCGGENYTYELSATGDTIHLKLINNHLPKGVLYDGQIDDFEPKDVE